MKENLIFRRFPVAFVLAAILFLLGCPTTNPLDSQNDAKAANNRQENMQSSPKNNENTKKDTKINENISKDIDELAKNINLPVRPVEALWTKKMMNNEQGRVPGPNDYFLTAVLKYDEADIEKLFEKKDEPFKGVVEIQEWFPEDLKKLGKNFDGEKLLSGEKYDAKNFARSPYSNGTILRVNNFLILTFSST